VSTFEIDANARTLQQDLGLLTNTTQFRDKIFEFPLTEQAAVINQAEILATSPVLLGVAGSTRSATAPDAGQMITAALLQVPYRRNPGERHQRTPSNTGHVLASPRSRLRAGRSHQTRVSCAQPEAVRSPYGTTRSCGLLPSGRQAAQGQEARRSKVRHSSAKWRLLPIADPPGPEAQVSGYALRRAYFSKPRMYGRSGGRDPVLNCGPRVER
jgi:hypothetical protein